MENYKEGMVFIPVNNKVRLFTLLIGLVLISLAWLSYNDESIGIYRIIYSIGLGLGGLFLVVTSWISMFKRTSGIYLNRNTLLIKMTWHKLEIPWMEIKQFKKIGNDRYIGIELFNNEKFVASQRGLIKRVGERLASREGIAFKILIKSYDVSPGILWKVFNDHLEVNRFS